MESSVKKFNLGHHIDTTNFFFYNDLMKKFLAIIILSLCFIIPSQADDIRDFEIDGMSVKVSLLEYFDKNYIKKNKVYFEQAKGNKEYAKLELGKSSIYESLQITFKDDQTFKIVAVEGFIFFKNDIKSCLSRRERVIKELSEIFKSQIKSDFGKKKHFIDNNSFTYNYVIGFGSRAELYTQHYDAIAIACYDWSKKLPYFDSFRLSIRTKELNQWLDRLNK